MHQLYSFTCWINFYNLFQDRCSRIDEEYNRREQQLSKQYEEMEKQLN